jgi:hypothetical protein
VDDQNGQEGEHQEEEDQEQDSDLVNELDTEDMRAALAEAEAEGAGTTAEQAFMLAHKADTLEALVGQLQGGMQTVFKLVTAGMRAAYRRQTTSPSSRDTAYWEGRNDALGALLETLMELGYIDPPGGD